MNNNSSYNNDNTNKNCHLLSKCDVFYCLIIFIFFDPHNNLKGYALACNFISFSILFWGYHLAMLPMMTSNPHPPASTSQVVGIKCMPPSTA